MCVGWLVSYALESIGSQCYRQGFVSGFQRPLKRFTDVGKVLKKLNRMR